MARDLPARVGTVTLMAVAYSTCEVVAYADGRPRVFGIVFGGGAHRRGGVARPVRPPTG
jgi:hypothetical protein